MIESMSGYGTYSEVSENQSIDVEIRSLNSKYIDISINIINPLKILELELRNLIKDSLKRGSIYLYVSIKSVKSFVKPILNKELFWQYLKILSEIQKESDILDDIKIEHILACDNIIVYEQENKLDDELREFIIMGVKHAVLNLKEMREKEGVKIKRYLDEQIKNLSLINSKIRQKADGQIKNIFNKIKKRLDLLISEIEDERIMQEVAIFAQKSDITEEVDRIDSHIAQFNEIAEKEYPCGKKLDFLTQELLREFNTIASKAEDIEIKKLVINAKTNVNEIKEQIQNIV
ncbi:MAG: YicC/YloC family endoribonuclease [Deferribacterota bacterium]|nr:YicC/YloC family endoribonuclease [Deferribacterota bacterium]